MILRILVSLSLILVVQKLTRQLAAAVAAGALLLGLWSGHSGEALLAISWNRLASADNLLLMLIIVLVIWLSSQMQRTGVMADLVGSVRARLSTRASMAALPAVIGLLPMPGGALFSAPLLDDADPSARVPALTKTRINYWFRHIWEYWWPLYPGVLLSIDLAGLPVWLFMLVQFPLSLVAILGGYLFILRGVPAGEREMGSNAKSFFGLILPIAVVIIVYTLVQVLMPGVARASKYLPMAFGLLSAMVVLQFQRPLQVRDWQHVVASPKPLLLAFIVALVRIYGAFVEAKLPGGVFLMDQVRAELNAVGIPPLLLVMLIPFVSGVTTGVSVGFVGASFPVVLRLMGADPPLHLVLSTVVLAFGLGYTGMILSPVHVCLVVTNEHFRTSLFRSIRTLAAPAGVVVVGAVALSWLIRLAG
jgi:hypothetical protein